MIGWLVWDGMAAGRAGWLVWDGSWQLAVLVGWWGTASMDGCLVGWCEKAAGMAGWLVGWRGTAAGSWHNLFFGWLLWDGSWLLEGLAGWLVGWCRTAAGS